LGIRRRAARCRRARGVVRDQFVACVGPGAAQRGAARGGAEPGAHRRVQQVLDGVPECGVVADEVAGAAGQDQVARAATIRRTEFVTPLTTGRKHSETIATRTRRAWGHHRSTARRRGDGARNVCRTLDRLRRRGAAGSSTGPGVHGHRLVGVRPGRSALLARPGFSAARTPSPPDPSS